MGSARSAAGTLAVDHVFFAVTAAEASPGGAVFEALARAGLAPSYRRIHHGQGTANVCYCFDDAFLELLFATDARELAQPHVRATRLAERTDWVNSGASPVGIALRGGELPVAGFDYRFDALPPGLSIRMATDAADPEAPLVFVSPGNAPPIDWTDGRAGNRQARAGWSRLGRPSIHWPDGKALPPSLEVLVSAGLVALHDDPAARLAFELDGPRGAARLELPSGAVTPVS